ncbi:hypothetical protein [Amnibacterium endophyticum]|uniref:Integral membrane protein n=1 Tax=Amnibacterium endophyticum TaxID=2109337 RepID=A0ABW4LH90_9MICO
MTETRPARPRTAGPGRVLIAFYFVMTLAALVRSVVQMITDFAAAPLAIVLSFVAGVVYLVATIALARSGRTAFRLAFTTIVFELIGVLLVGTLSLVLPEVFPFRYTVWWGYGLGYLLLPLVLPVLGLLFLRSQRAVFAEEG